MVENLYSSKHNEYCATVRHRPIEFFPASNGRLLDVGSGNGATSRFLVEKGRATASVVVDPFSTAEDFPNVQFMKEDASVDFFEKLQAEGEQFDTVLCLDIGFNIAAIDVFLVVRFKFMARGRSS